MAWQMYASSRGDVSDRYGDHARAVDCVTRARRSVRASDRRYGRCEPSDQDLSVVDSAEACFLEASSEAASAVVAIGGSFRYDAFTRRIAVFRELVRRLFGFEISDEEVFVGAMVNYGASYLLIYARDGDLCVVFYSFLLRRIARYFEFGLLFGLGCRIASANGIGALHRAASGR